LVQAGGVAAVLPGRLSLGHPGFGGQGVRRKVLDQYVEGGKSRLILPRALVTEPQRVVGLWVLASGAQMALQGHDGRLVLAGRIEDLGAGQIVHLGPAHLVQRREGQIGRLGGRLLAHDSLELRRRLVGASRLTQGLAHPEPDQRAVGGINGEGEDFVVGGQGVIDGLRAALGDGQLLQQLGALGCGQLGQRDGAQYLDGLGILIQGHVDLGNAPLHIQGSRIIQGQDALVGVDGPAPVARRFARHGQEREHAQEALALARLRGQLLEQGQGLIAPLLLQVGCG